MIFEVENYITLKSAVEKLCAFLSAEQIPDESIFDSKLVAYELLGNVLRHSGGKARLRGEVREEMIELEILAEKVFCPPEAGECAGVFSESGRGLFLVDSVCEERRFTEKGGILVRIRIR